MSVGIDARVVQQHLQNLESFRDARELLAELNYQPARYALPVPNTPRAQELAGPPEVIAEHGDFRVIYSRLATQDRLPRGTERPIVEQLLRDHPYSLFLFSDDDGSHWDFVNIKHEREGRPRRVYRRISIGPDERALNRLRTASEQLTKIALPDGELARLERAPLAIQGMHDEAFDVEQVSKKFYTAYREVFEQVEKQIEGIEDRDRLRYFTQRLFNRLMFLAFIQKKGWLKLDGETDYLNALWRAYRADPDATNFYESRLKLLFFTALDNPAGRNYMDDHPAGSALRTLLGEVPYLNGGLFEKHDDDRDESIVVPDEAIERILDGLFNSFNFTVTESTPLDVEVAVDPEMLGKVFEELVTGRHESGSYYTPKPIVSFMCREALKAYLTTRLPGESAEAIEALVDDHRAEDVRDPEGLLEVLKTVTACDPACGSGAYLLGMLHELLDIRRALFASRNVDPKSEYDRKLEIIQNNLYGVDIDPFATNIAKLRLWLSLAVDYEGERPEPLPNLDFKIETGDSLLSQVVGVGQQLALRKQQIEEFQRAKAAYMMAHGADKQRLHEEIEQRKAQLEIWTHGGAKAGKGFDWPVEFAEVFASGGFDIVLANPPYVRQELIKDIKPDLQRVYGPLYSGTADLYVYFYYRALEILKPGGALAFISSNKWFKANYGQKLREHVVRTTDVLSITDFGELPVFEAAATFPMIFIARKGQPTGQRTLFTEVISLEPPYPEMKVVTAEAGELLPKEALGTDRWLLTDEGTVNLILTMERDTIPLGKYVDGQIYRGVLTGFNEAFVIDGARRAELIAADPKSAEIIKPLAVGDDIRKWRVRDRNRWLIVTEIGVSIKRYPAVFEHLSQWKSQLQKRYDKGKHWWELRACAYYDEFDKPKIIFPDIAKESRFSFDDEAYFTTNTAYFIPRADLGLLGVLNSQTVWRYASEQLTVLGNADSGGRLRFFTQFVEKLPVPVRNPNELNEIAGLVRQCLGHVEQGEDARALEEQIDERVAWLFGVHL